MVPNLSFLALAVFTGLRVVWKAPDWGLKVVQLARAIRRYRQEEVLGEGDQDQLKRS